MAIEQTDAMQYDSGGIAMQASGLTYTVIFFDAPQLFLKARMFHHKVDGFSSTRSVKVILVSSIAQKTAISRSDGKVQVSWMLTEIALNNFTGYSS